jgi:hypothetical protein
MKEPSSEQQINNVNETLNKEQEKRAELFVITWDNPTKIDSSGMRDALKKFGKIKKLYVKTTVAL